MNTRNEYEQLVTTVSYNTGVKSTHHVQYVIIKLTPHKNGLKTPHTHAHVHTHSHTRANTHTNAIPSISRTGNIQSLW